VGKADDLADDQGDRVDDGGGDHRRDQDHQRAEGRAPPTGGGPPRQVVVADGGGRGRQVLDGALAMLGHGRRMPWRGSVRKCEC
jgi:hypothetical protein